MKIILHNRLRTIPYVLTKSNFFSFFKAILFLAFTAFSFSLQAQVEVSVEGTHPTCGGFSNGTATALPSGGWDPYTFVWSNGETTQTIYGLSAGTYTVTATDLDGGYNYASITLSAAPQTEVDIVVTDICSGNGDATINATGGNPPYTYNWSDGGSGPIRTDLEVETQYCVTVLDVNLCGVITCTVIPEALQVDVVATGVACSTACDGSVVATINGGDSPYSILWSNGVTSSINGNLPVGTYTVTITDGNGCMAIGSGTIGAPAGIDLDLMITPPSCNNDTNGSATVFASGGTPGYEYEWSTGATSQTVVGLSEGVYGLTVTDTQGCEAMQDVVIEAADNLILTVQTNNPTCNATNGGSATASTTGGTPSYSYLWNTGSTNATVFNLDAGTYTVTVTDANGCDATETIVLSQEGATILATISEQNATCGENNGGMNAFGSGGSGNYSYEWSNGAITQMITDLGAGTYTVTVTDDETGCMASKTEFITNTDAVEVTTNATNTTCNANNGIAMAIPTEGTPSYSFAWSNGANTQQISGLAAGSYTVTVTDANGCTATSTAIVGQNESNIIVMPNSSNLECNGDNTGAVGISVSGGSTPYSFLWNTGATTLSVNNLGAGTYTVTVTDNLGCTATAVATISEPTELSVNINTIDAECANSNDGSATANVSGGTAGYSYAWSTGANTQTITGLSGGAYIVTVTDANGCTEIEATTIAQPSNISISINNTDVSCTGGNDGTAIATVVGGSPNYSYSWSNGANTSSITNLGTGTYLLTVTDSNGCIQTASTSISLGDYAAVSCFVSVINPISTFNSNDGALSVNVSNGSGSYTYQWSNGNTGASNNNLSAGTYSVTVTDTTTGCTTECSASLTSPAEPTAKVGDKVFFDINLDGDNDDVDDGVAGVTVTLTGTTNSGVAINLTTITDVNGMYLFDELEGGTYKVTFSNLPEDTEFTVQNSGDSDESDSDANVGTGMTAFFDLADGECNLTIDAGIVSGCSCDNFTDGGSICCNQTACGPGYDPDIILSTALPTGGSGNEPVEYMWMYREGVGTFNGTQVQPIPNSNSPTYDPGPIYTTTTFYRCTRRSSCCPFIEAIAGVTVYINDDADASFTGPNQNILCQGETYTFTANTNSPTADFQWTVQGNPVSITDLDESSIEVVWASNGFYDIQLSVTDNACTASTLENHLVTNSPDYCGQGNFGLIIDATVIHSADVQIELIRDGQSEGEFAYFIERSKLGEDFEEIGRIDLSNGSYYEYNDVEPFRGRSFYRVRMMDELGLVSYSNTEEITIFVGIENTMVYPNPFRGFIHYEIKDTYGDDVTLEIVSPDGRVVRTFVTDKDTFQQTVNLDGLADGIYFLKFHFSGVGVQTYKMLKQ